MDEMEDDFVQQPLTQPFSQNVILGYARSAMWIIIICILFWFQTWTLT